RQVLGGLAIGFLVIELGATSPARGQCATQQLAKLTAGDAVQFENFGAAAAISGDTAVIGSPYNQVVSANDGAAYVYVRNGIAWPQQARLAAADGAGGDNFGNSAGISGDSIVI